MGIKTGLLTALDIVLFRSRRINTTPITSSRTLTHVDIGHTLVDATAGNIVIILPASDASLGAVDHVFRRTDSTTNTVTIQTAGADKFVFDDPVGVSSVLLAGQGAVLALRADAASKWYPQEGTASQATLNAGVDDTQSVTSKKLRFGFLFQSGPIGYLVFPTWLGGLTFQWGNVVVPINGFSTVPFPIIFPTNLFFVGATGTINTVSSSTVQQTAINVYARSTSSISLANDDSAQTVLWLAIGN